MELTETPNYLNFYKKRKPKKKPKKKKLKKNLLWHPCPLTVIVNSFPDIVKPDGRPLPCYVKKCFRFHVL